jgi:hypothetical protein
MYRVSKESYGFELKFGGAISLDEMKQWRVEAVRALVGAPSSFGVLIDMRTLQRDGIDQETQEAIVEGIGLSTRFKLPRTISAGQESRELIFSSAILMHQLIPAGGSRLSSGLKTKWIPTGERAGVESRLLRPRLRISPYAIQSLSPLPPSTVK